ncbi:MAG: hypothetical protein ACI35R_09550 [Bacillus sp. (in: firmicutes)]
MKNNMIKIFLIVNMILGILSTAGVAYLIFNQHNAPEMGERMGGGTPPQMQNEDQQTNIDSDSSTMQ